MLQIQDKQTLEDEKQKPLWQRIRLAVYVVVILALSVSVLIAMFRIFPFVPRQH